MADLIRFTLRANRSGATEHEMIEDRAVSLERFDDVFAPSAIEDVLEVDPGEVFCAEVPTAP